MTAPIALVPLDERPVCTALAVETAAIAGVGCELPPPDLLPDVRTPGNADSLAAWLHERRAGGADTVVSLDTLAFGGLIPSRIGDEAATTALARWDALRNGPGRVRAFMLVPRTPDSTDAFEEPSYWSEHGPSLHALSAALAEGAAMNEAGAGIPEPVRLDWIGRRLRQHVLTLSALAMSADGGLDQLVIGIDDASERSLSAADQKAAQDWIDRLGINGKSLVQPGADELGAVLTARSCQALLSVEGPLIGVLCPDRPSLDRSAPYESSPVKETIRRQITAAGGTACFDSSRLGQWDAVMVVHPPESGHGDWAVGPFSQTDERIAAGTVNLLGSVLGTGALVGVADIGRPNGADPHLVSAIDGTGAWNQLTSFAAWNTAGNTIGTVAAQLTAAHCGTRAGTFDADRARLAVARRLVEDYGWMSVERRRVRSELSSPAQTHDAVTPPDATNPVLAAAETRLNRGLRERTGMGAAHIVPGTLRLPWGRTFEMDAQMEFAHD